MSKIVAFDIGQKRIGVAVTDDLQIIASPFKTILNHELGDFIDEYLSKNKVSNFVVGMPKNLKGDITQGTHFAQEKVNFIKRKYPSIPLSIIDERFTSKMAMQSITKQNLKRSVKQNKANIDMVSACIILQSYLTQKQNDLI